MQHMDLQNIPEYIGRQQLCSFLSKWHLNHMGWGCMDLVALLLVVGLKKNVWNMIINSNDFQNFKKNVYFQLRGKIMQYILVVLRQDENGSP